MPRIFQIELSALTRQEYIDFVLDRIKGRNPCYVVTPNLNYARLAFNNDHFKSALESAELRLCDSAILSGILTIKGQRLPARLTGSDLTPNLLQLAEEHGLKVFLFGSDAWTLNRVRNKYRKAVCGMISPPMHHSLWELDDLNELYLREIRDAKPDILFIALGAKKSEFWARKYYKSANVPLMMSVGASLDFIAGRVRRSPQFLNKIGLEWAWRLLMEPGRLTRRYTEDALFLARNILPELLGFSQQTK